MSWVPPASAKPEYSDWTIEAEVESPTGPTDRREYLGMAADGETPVFYDPEAGTVYRGEIDTEAQRLVPDPEPSWELDPGETLGEFLERFGEETGWESLSEFARDHLEDGS